MAVLYYVHDPMCSWCWAFRPVWEEVRNGLTDLPVRVVNLLGGLAGDTDEPMPADMQQMIRGIWQQIQKQVPGTTFNFSFWEDNQPRRSTYPACRAVLAAERQQHEPEMITAIQQAYYLRAMNPSDDTVLRQLASGMGLDEKKFATDLHSAETRARLAEQIRLAHSLPIQGFPSLVLEAGGRRIPVPVDYHSAARLLQDIRDKLAAV